MPSQPATVAATGVHSVNTHTARTNQQPSMVFNIKRASSAVDEFNSGSFVYHIDLFLLALIILLIILRAPRLIARLGSPSSWLNYGHILRYSHLQRPVRRTRGKGSYDGTHGDIALPEVGAVSPRHMDMPSADSHTLQTHDYHLYNPNNRRAGNNTSGRLPRGPEPQYPAHLASCPRVFRGLARPLGWRVSSGFSLAQALVCLLWFLITLYATLYKSTGTFTDPTRAGWVGIAQLPFVFAFGTKNNVIGGLLGMGYEKLNFIHRFVARLVVLAVNVHVIGFCESSSYSHICSIILIVFSPPPLSIYTLFHNSL